MTRHFFISDNYEFSRTLTVQDSGGEPLIFRYFNGFVRITDVRDVVNTFRLSHVVKVCTVQDTKGIVTGVEITLKTNNSFQFLMNASDVELVHKFMMDDEDAQNIHWLVPTILIGVIAGVVGIGMIVWALWLRPLELPIIYEITKPINPPSYMGR